MSSFNVQVRRLSLTPHPNADKLEIGQVDGYQFIVGKDQFKDGDLGVYIPEQAVVPDELISQMGLTGRLSGPQANRVKAVKLRGVVSQGLFYRPAGDALPGHWDDGTDVAEELGIKKYEPEVPTYLRGEMAQRPGNTPKSPRIPHPDQSSAPTAVDTDVFGSYDLENIKHFPNALIQGQPVIMTEKLHGTCLCVGIIGGEEVVSSKGVAAKGFVLKPSETNTYWRAARQFNLFDRLRIFLDAEHLDEVMLYGEILGVQDLMYDLAPGELTFRAFDLKTRDGFMSYGPFLQTCRLYGIPTVPVLYHGPFSQAKLDEHTSGKSSLADHIREGVVVRPLIETYHPHIGRLVFKSVSPAYLTRKGDTTEFN